MLYVVVLGVVRRGRKSVEYWMPPGSARGTVLIFKTKPDTSKYFAYVRSPRTMRNRGGVLETRANAASCVEEPWQRAHQAGRTYQRVTLTFIISTTKLVLAFGCAAQTPLAESKIAVPDTSCCPHSAAVSSTSDWVVEEVPFTLWLSLRFPCRG